MRNESSLPTSAANNDILHLAYYPFSSTNATTLSHQCLQQCYGFGGGKQCKTAFWARKMPVPEGYYGIPGGQPMTAYLLCKSIDKGRLHNRARRPGLECFRLEYRMLKKGCGVNYIDEAA